MIDYKLVHIKIITAAGKCIYRVYSLFFCFVFLFGTKTYLFYLQGEYIWVKPVTNGEFDIPVAGKILSIDSKRIKVKGDDNDESYISHQQVLKIMHITSVKGVEDMIALGDLQEYAILRNLHVRYNLKQIYVIPKS